MNTLASIQEAIDIVKNARKENLDYNALWEKMFRIEQHLQTQLQAELNQFEQN